MQTIMAEEAGSDFDRLIDRARHEPVTVTRQGRKVAVVIAAEDYRKMLSESIWGKLTDIEEVLPAEELIREHREAGVPMYYSDEGTPEGYSKCLLPDGTETLVADGKLIDWPPEGT